MTVVIPVWGARYVASLERAIASVRAQDADVPIIVADNASDVEVPEISGTTLVRSPRRLSVGEARNLGLERVETEYVVILDADDELTAGALTSLRAGIDADPSIAVYAMSLLDADTGARHRTPRRLRAGADPRSAAVRAGHRHLVAVSDPRQRDHADGLGPRRRGVHRPQW